MTNDLPGLGGRDGLTINRARRSGLMALASTSGHHAFAGGSLRRTRLPCSAFNPSRSRRSPVVMLTKHVVPPMLHTGQSGLPAFSSDSFEPPDL